MLDSLFPGQSIDIEYKKPGFWKNKYVIRSADQRLVCQFVRMRRAAAGLETLFRLLSGQGVAAQQLLRSGKLPHPGLHCAHYFVASYVEGQRPTRECPKEDVEAIGRELGRLHSISTHGGWGRLVRWLPLQSGGHWRYLRGWAFQGAGTLSRTADSASEAAELRSWIEHRGAALDDVLDFRLMHGDLTAANVLLHERRAHFIDYDMMQFGLPQHELAGCFHLPFCRGDDGTRWNALVSAYRSTVPAEVFALWERHAPLFLLLATLYWGQRRVHRAGRSNGRRDAGSIARSYWRLCRRIISDHPDGAGDWRLFPALRDSTDTAP